MRSFKQELVAVFGQPVAENPTQAMVEAAFRYHGLDWRYLTVEVAPDDLAAAVAGARAMGFRGFHCTIPHKVAVVPLLDRLGESAELIGAVNTVVAREREVDTPPAQVGGESGGRLEGRAFSGVRPLSAGAALVGENTDGRGFVESLRRRRDPAGRSVVVLGAGGAARAIAVELVLAGAGELTIVNRSEEPGRELGAHAGEVAARTGHGLQVSSLAWPGDLTAPACDVLVNATSIGLADPEARVPVDLAGLAAETLVADVIPNPPRTRLLREAEARGLPTLDGLEMLVEQGALSVEYWTGVDPDRDVMRAALAEVFAGA